MIAYQLSYVNFGYNRKTGEKTFGKGFYVEDEGIGSAYKAPIMYFKNEADILQYFNAYWIPKFFTKDVDREKITMCIKNSQAKRGYPYKMYFASKIEISDEFSDAVKFFDFEEYVKIYG